MPTLAEIIKAVDDKYVHAYATYRTAKQAHVDCTLYAKMLPDMDCYTALHTKGQHGTCCIELTVFTRHEADKAMEVLKPASMMKWVLRRGTDPQFWPYDLLTEEQIQDSTNDLSTCAPFYWEYKQDRARVTWFTCINDIWFTVVCFITQDGACTVTRSQKGYTEKVQKCTGFPYGNDINLWSPSTPHKIVWFYDNPENKTLYGIKQIDL